ncbi:Signal transduction histidine kinase [Anaerovirgula multivorans]|uniref:histidine kinase n=1 Tax=Anaerovirgula multivorans TaxID=312168 RepID=A0A239CFE5_9FIRM|nr:HAMP domain-containing sensor histidine kinase [Anaerovirgula multivorans]SNS18612.1 Signal transduction histidine kinase [Anaerovirgula multivorans]
MSIKLRLLLSYIALLLVPITLTAIVGYFAGSYYIGAVHEAYPGFDKIHDVRQGVARQYAFFSNIKQAALISPEKFQDEDYLSKVEQRLADFNSSFIVRKNDEIIYAMPALLEIVKGYNLPQFGEYEHETPIHSKDIDSGLLLNQHDFYFSDGSQGSIFLVTNMEPIWRSFQELVNTIMITIVVILVITNGTLTYLVAGSIVKPLSKLKDSANRIKEGDLDFEININSKDEIGELSHAFEEMRKRLKDSLDIQLQYEENRKELLANISHDLKTPITTIKGYVEGIRDGVADTPNKIEKYMNTIYTKTVDVDQLIDDLLLFSKLDLSKLPLHLSTIDISKYLMDLLEELKFDLEKKNVAIKYDSKIDESIFAMVDLMQLKRVVVNIVENAVKYMDKPQGTVDIILEKSEEQVVVEIKDNGQGISEDTLPYIFDRFYRGDPSRNTATGGSGLGLAIAKKIIEEHGGRMWAESIEGTGTSIFFTLKNIRSGDVL